VLAGRALKGVGILYRLLYLHLHLYLQSLILRLSR
jgi:hypothetical protein